MIPIIFIIVVILILIGISFHQYVIEPKLDRKKGNQLIVEYEDIATSIPNMNGYFDFIKLYLEKGIYTDCNESLAFSVFHMRYHEMRDVLATVKIERNNGLLIKELEPVLNQFTYLASKYKQHEESLIRVELYNNMISLNRKLQTKIKDNILVPID